MARLNSWLTNHWRIVMWCMLMVMMMQQCTISRLRWEVTQMTQSLGSQPAPAATGSAAPSDSALAAAPDTALAPAPAEAIDEEAETAGGMWVAALVLVIAAGCVVGLIYMRRNAIYPFGIVIRGKLRSDLTYHIRVANKSRRQVEVAEPLVVFIMGGTVRKFRANVPQLPMTLDRGTSFEANIDLGGLVRANIDLAAAKAINMSISTNGKRHSTLPTPVKIKTA